MKAIILSAGIGKRLRQSVLPKCLLKIGRKTLLKRQIKILNNLGIKEIILIIGYQGKCWTKNNIEKIKRIHKQIIINKKNIDLKRPYSLFCGLKGLKKDDIIIIDGDLVFEENLIKKIISDKRKNLLLARYIESRNTETKGSKILTRNNNKIVKIGYGFASNKLFLGILKIGKKDFYLLKQIFSQEKNWKKSLSGALEEFIDKTNLYASIINAPLLITSKGKNKKTEPWKPGINRIIKKGNIIRKETKTGRHKLINEINFIQNLPENIRKHFPKIIKYNINKKKAYYDMEYCSFPLFADLIFNQIISPQDSLRLLKIILDFVFNNLYKINVKETPVGFIESSYFNKIEQRVNSIKGRSDLFDKIVSAHYLIINRKRYKNFKIIINDFKQDAQFLSTIEPPVVASYHGDFKFDNILIDPNTGDFILIDPRGKTAAGHDQSDIIEDMAKLFTSCHGYYDIFYRGLFDMIIKEKKDRGIVIDYKLKSKKIINHFDEISIGLIKLLPLYKQIRIDKNWKKRLFFIESILLIANAPFHLNSKKNEKFSIALLVRGIELLNNFLNKYPLNQDKKFNVININTLEDYNYAKEFFKQKRYNEN